ncbi:hypothetical protein [Ruminococcus sp. NK3A76]|uniref:hypothetical protein n=1 Tax=Ruminococcus sp. NK3A76 TaxID=877411 RepID=UPI00048A93A3|nr:hypothetical protein [Ruminococcus sp. NK3A76]
MESIIAFLFFMVTLIDMQHFVQIVLIIACLIGIILLTRGIIKKKKTQDTSESAPNDSVTTRVVFIVLLILVMMSIAVNYLPDIIYS